MKESVRFFVLLTVFLLLGGHAFAESGQVRVEIDGEMQHYDDQPPVIDEGRTLVPLRGIFESLGAEVTWIGGERRIEAVTSAASVSLIVGETDAQVNGEAVTLDVPAQIRNGRTLVPVRFISEALGATVHWDSATRLVSIYDQTDPSDRSISEGVTGSSAVIARGESKESLLNRGVTHVTDGDTSIFIGYRQVTANNQDPVMVRFDDGKETWYRDDIETSGDDGQGYGLLWDGGDDLYAVFSATGTQGSSDEDYRRYTRDGWLTSYGQGGGAKVAVILRMDAQSGEGLGGTFLTSRLSDGRTNSMLVNGLSFNGERLTVEARSWYRPLDVNRRTMNVDHLDGSPFDYTIVFDRHLQEAIQAVVR